MKVAIFALTLLAAAYAEEKAEETLEVSETSYAYPAYDVLSHGLGARGYDAHGQHAAGHGAYGVGHYGDHGQYGDSAYGAHGQHSLGAYGAHDAYGAQGSNYGKYRNVGAYIHNRGAGYEKAYAYDKKSSSHDILADHGAKYGKHGVHDSKGFHDIGSYGSLGHDSHGAYGKYGGYGHGSHGYDSGAHGLQGGAYSNVFYKAPGHGYHY